MCVCVCVYTPQMIRAPKEHFFLLLFSLSNNTCLQTFVSSIVVESRSPRCCFSLASRSGPIMDPSSRGPVSSSSTSSSSVPPPPPCKFFLAGSCTKPDCAFAHDVQTAPTTVCPFYKKGRENSCTYGDKCRYDHHVSEARGTQATTTTTTTTTTI